MLLNVIDTTNRNNPKLIVGLGNPGRKYKTTRHNVGFMFVDEVVKAYQEKFILDKSKYCEISELYINGEKVIIVKPQTYMNLSGKAVAAVVNYYKIPIENILVVYDDLDIEIARIKFKPTGSSAGHKGMQSIINCLGTRDIKRLRIGIEKNKNTNDHVLGNFKKEEKISIDLVIEKAENIINDFVKFSFDALMNKYN